ncbi:helix-turn-helix transcriptional regulator [Rhodomicrobium vannielii ATCC 17100]|uniref:winged helix-turn-helix transcriptional regulator n=1 Tax=Rhodomicrobium vannielii TaxID=1069 RepID=UPI001918D3F0|nr:helix-turn-helix domain-containing protein [Rhodomicrobium vannielii]MBJ7533139.1 helix-turn-helix transcriptional regulator [Rhodomicrobium vannielii ATCC 17100]
MTRTDEKVGYSPQSKSHGYTRETATDGIEQALRMIEGRWKLVILFHLFGGRVLRFSELERAIPSVSQKMLIQQLRQMEADGIVCRTVYPEVPPKVEYHLTDWGQSLCPALDALLTWAASRPA